MSLRLRLLAAVGLIAIIALVVADFATYSALRNSLYGQVDQQLAHQVPRGIDELVDPITGSVTFNRHCPSPYPSTVGAGPVDNNGGPSGNSGAASGNSGAAPGNSGAASGNSGATPGNSGPEPGGGGGRAFPNVFGISYLAVVRQNGGVVEGLECPAYVDGHPYRPQLPSQITGFTTQPDGSQVAYFTTASIASGGPAFRVQATKFQSGPLRGDIVVQAQAVADQTSTLHTLFLTSSRSPRPPSCWRWWAAGGSSASACARWRTSSARPTPSRQAIWTSGCRAQGSPPRWAASPGRST